MSIYATFKIRTLIKKTKYILTGKSRIFTGYVIYARAGIQLPGPGKTFLGNHKAAKYNDPTGPSYPGFMLCKNTISPNNKASYRLIYSLGWEDIPAPAINLL